MKLKTRTTSIGHISCRNYTTC